MHGETEPSRRPLAQRLLGGSAALWEGSALVALAATLLPLADLWLCFAPPRPDHHAVVGLTVLVPLLVYLVTFPLLRLQPPERLQRLLLVFLGGAAFAALAYLLLSVRFVRPLDDRWNRDVFGWAYTAEAQRHRARHPGISDLELVKDGGSRIEDVFEPTSLVAARGLLLACWFALAAGGSLALTAALALRRLTPLDVRLAGLSPQVRLDIRTDLRHAQRTLRLADNPKGVLLHGSSLGLKLLDVLFQRAGRRGPSDNLYDCIVTAAQGDSQRKIKGLGLLPREKASHLHDIRTMSNKVDHDSAEYDREYRATTADAENMLALYLRVLEWFYCEYDGGPRLPGIYGHAIRLTPLSRREAAAAPSAAEGHPPDPLSGSAPGG